MIVSLLIERHLEFLSLKGGCTCSSGSTLVKIPHCWILHVTAHLRNDEISTFVINARGPYEFNDLFI